MATRDDPYLGHNFLVALGDAGGEDQPVAGFTSVTGLGLQIDQVRYRVGNEQAAAARVLPGLRHYSNVVLQRGVVGDLSLWQWIQADPPSGARSPSPCWTSSGNQ